MIQKKICMLGAFAVGKTSLVARFVTSLFSEKYHTTVGVKIDKKEIVLDGRDVNMVIWDLAGEDELMKVRTSYLRGAAGYLLVVDGTRRDTLTTALQLRERVHGDVGELPHVVLVNKSDVVDSWEVDDAALAPLEHESTAVIRTSAKDGSNVDSAFELLARRVIGS